MSVILPILNMRKTREREWNSRVNVEKKIKFRRMKIFSKLLSFEFGRQFKIILRT